MDDLDAVADSVCSDAAPAARRKTDGEKDGWGMRGWTARARRLVLMVLVASFAVPAVADAQAPAWYLTDTPYAGDPSTRYARFGNPGDIPVVGDWDNDGADSIGVARPASSGPLWWYLTNATTGSPPSIASHAYGNGTGMIPRPGDWNGDGKDTLGLAHPMTNGPIGFHLSNDNSVANIYTTYGNGTGHTPLVGDWNGDGIDTQGVYDRATAKFYLTNSFNGSGTWSFQYGTPDGKEQPITGDWDGDGKDTIGVVRQTGGAPIWFLRNSNTSGVSDRHFYFGNPGDKPLTGDWDGDGVDTAGVVLSTPYVTSVRFGGADASVNTDAEITAARTYFQSLDAPAFDVAWTDLSPGDQTRVDRLYVIREAISAQMVGETSGIVSVGESETLDVVEVGMRDPAGSEAVALKNRYGASISIAQEEMITSLAGVPDTPPVEGADTYRDPMLAGVRIYGGSTLGCTAGFMFNGRRTDDLTPAGVITAGHCLVDGGPKLTEWRQGGSVLGPFTTHRYLKSTYADAGTITTEFADGTGNFREISNRVFVGARQPTVAIERVAPSFEGRPGLEVCISGAYGGYNCGIIRRAGRLRPTGGYRGFDYKLTSGSKKVVVRRVYEMLRSRGSCRQGDSGAPVFRLTGTAMGIAFARDPILTHRCFFAQQSFVEFELNALTYTGN